MPRATLKRRPDGRYCTRYKGKDFYGATQSEAFAARDAYRKMLEQGMKKEALGVTVEEYAYRWVYTHKQHVQPNAFRTHTRILAKFCEAYGARLLRDIDGTDIQEFYNLYSGKSQSSINDTRDTIKGMFTQALADRAIVFNPALAANPPTGNKGTHRALAKPERALIHTVKHRFRPVVMVMLYAGLRRGEALAIDVDRDVDFENHTITVREAVRFELGRPVISDPKTEAGKRTIPLLDILFTELKGLHGLLAPAAHEKADGDGEPQPAIMSESAFDRAWSSYITALETELNGCHKRWYGKTKEQKELLEKGEKLPPWQSVNIRPHDLRHTYCTMLYDAGVDLKTAMKWMGHADQSMILRIYSHLTEEREKASAVALAKTVNDMLFKHNVNEQR